jgi:sucrose-6-phosphate hydrolase SacC (GH32 family)
MDNLEMPGVRECPDIFELPVDGDRKNTKWVFWGGNGNYVIGTFDGEEFVKETKPFRSEWGRNGYAGQSWSDIPESDGRRLQILWMNGGRFPGMPFNQQMSFPCEVTLRTFPEGIRLCRQPVREIANIHGQHHHWSDVAVEPGRNPLAEISGELFDIRAEIEVGGAAEVGLIVRGVGVVYDAKAKKLSCLGRSAPLEAVHGRIKLQILVDRTSVEVFANDGRIVMSFSQPLDPDQRKLDSFARAGKAKVASLDVWQLKSIWPK